MQALSAAAPAVPAHRSCERVRVVCNAKDKLCKDMVNLQPVEPFSSKGATFKVTFLTADEENVTIDCPDDMYILDAAEQAGIDLPCTCRGGICGACVVRVAEGAVDQSDIDDLSFTLDDDQLRDGMALICMARATSDVKLETQCDWGVRLGYTDWQGATGKLSSKPRSLVGEAFTPE